MKGSQLFDFGSSSFARVTSSASGGSGRSVSRFSMRRIGPPWLPPVSSAESGDAVDSEADDSLQPRRPFDHEGESIHGMVPP